MSRTEKTRLLTGIAVALAVTLSACGGGSSNSSTPTSPSPSNVVITINGMNGNQSFSPSNTPVTVGQTVAWHNADSIVHNIAEDAAGGFAVGTIAPGATSSSVLISTAGAHPYHCNIHPTMTGTVTAQ